MYGITWEKPEEKKSLIENKKKLYKVREKVVKLFDDYSRIACDAKYRAKQGKGLK